MNVQSTNARQRLRLTLSWALAVGAVLLAIVVFSISRGASAATAAAPDVDLSASTDTLRPGDTFSIKVRITNPLTTTLDKIVVKLDYDSAQVTPIDSDFNHDGDWVSSLSSSRVTLTFKDIGAKKSRSGKVFFRVSQPAPGNTSVDVHAKFNWYVNDSAGTLIKQGSGSSDGSSPLIVAPDGVLTNRDVIDSSPRTAIDPISGVVGTRFRAYASGFAGGERISIWLNTPNGVADVPHDLIANDSGEVWPEFASDSLAPGAYSLVIYGQDSTQTLVVPFTVSVAGGESGAPAGPQPPAPVPPPANIEPKAATAGTQFHAYGSGFAGGEDVSIWLNTPSGVSGIDRSFSTNGAGEVWPEFSSDGLAPGSYGLVIYGRGSGRTLVVPFTIVR
jgi:hypothetical protein